MLCQIRVCVCSSNDSEHGPDSLQPRIRTRTPRIVRNAELVTSPVTELRNEKADIPGVIYWPFV